MKDYMKAMLGMAYKAANPPVVTPQQQYIGNIGQAVGGQNQAAWGNLQQAAGNLQQATGNLQNQQAYANALQGGLGAGQLNQAAQNQMAGVAGQSVWPPAPQFEENVPEDELEFEGKLSRWHNYGALLPIPPRRQHHGIDCCQRCLML